MSCNFLEQTEQSSEAVATIVHSLLSYEDQNEEEEVSSLPAENCVSAEQNETDWEFYNDP